MNWLLAHKENLSKCDTKPLIPGIVSCLQDRSASIRNASELLFAEVISYVGMEAFQPFFKDLKPAVMNSLSLILDKYRNSTVNFAEENVISDSKLNAKQTHKIQNRSKALKLTLKPEENYKSPIPKPEVISHEIVNMGNKDKRLEQDSKINGQSKT